MQIEYVGHATTVVDLDGVRLLTDPLLRNRVGHLRRAVPVDAKALRGVDAVLVSHAHYDHLDLPSLEKLGKKLPVVLPRGLGGLLRKKRFESVVEVEIGETVRIGSLAIRVVPAEHDPGRAPFGVTGQPVGYVVEGTQTAYFAGDTDLFEGMAELGRLDVALVPIWGWGPGLGPGHLDPAGAARAVALLRPRVVVPIHWGTYFPIHLGLRGAPRFLNTPPDAFLAALAEVAPTADVRVLRPGQSVDVEAG